MRTPYEEIVIKLAEDLYATGVDSEMDIMCGNMQPYMVDLERAVIAKLREVIAAKKEKR
jgi:hypothetical protein